MRVLRIDHSSVVPAYRQRDRLLVERFGCEVMLVVPKRWPHLGSEQPSEPEPIAIREAGTYLTGNIPLFAYDASHVSAAIREFQPDVIDIHEEPYSVSAYQLSLLAGKLAPKSASVVYASQNIVKRYPPPFCWTEQQVYQRVQAAYPCSSGAMDVLRLKGFEKPAPVIGLGFDPQAFRPGKGAREQFNLSDGQFVIGFFGRIESAKGIDVLVHALQRLVNEGADAVVLVAGSGGEQPYAEALARQLGVHERVRFLGPQPVSALPSIYRSCDAVAVPSLTTRSWKEQFGRVVVEAMACHIPVVVSDSGSLPEVGGECCLRTPEGNELALAGALLRLAGDKEFALTLAGRGYERAHSLYTWSKVAEQTAELYKLAVRAKKNG